MRGCHQAIVIAPCEAQAFVQWIDALEAVAKTARRSRRRAFLATYNPLTHWAEDDDLDDSLAVLDKLIRVGG